MTSDKEWTALDLHILLTILLLSIIGICRQPLSVSRDNREPSTRKRRRSLLEWHHHGRLGENTILLLHPLVDDCLCCVCNTTSSTKSPVVVRAGYSWIVLVNHQHASQASQTRVDGIQICRLVICSRFQMSPVTLILFCRQIDTNCSVCRRKNYRVLRSYDWKQWVSCRVWCTCRL